MKILQGSTKKRSHSITKSVPTLNKSSINMKKVNLIRKKTISEMESKSNRPICILGKLYFEDKEIAATIENPWLDNAEGISCIPSGKYQCVEDKTGKFQWWKILYVDGRKDIEIHQGNYVKDTAGCIIIGEGWSWGGVTGEEPKVFSSVKTLKKLQGLLGSEFILEVK